MKRIGCWIALSLIGLLFIIVIGIGLWTMDSYNQLVRLDQEVKAMWSQVENQYQRRLDLLPNMVEVVKRYVQHEQKVFKDIADARSHYTGAPAASAEKIKAAGELNSAFARLLAIAENYPNLKANGEFIRLMDQWEGTENRIAVERMRFNDTVKQYNVVAMSVTGRLWVMLFGFEQSKPYFEAIKGAEKAPSAKEAFDQ